MAGFYEIALERYRQIGEEAYTFEHDDKHTDGALLDAAMSYLSATLLQYRWPESWDDQPGWHTWPFDTNSWKPSDDPIRNLVKAGALIAAEIDRLERVANG